MEDEYIEILVRDFPGSSYESFAGYVYGKLSEKIKNCQGREKNKYIKIRNRILKYIAANRSAITSKLRRHK